MGYKSLPEAINARYGTLACFSFGAAVLYRLFQEVWSNSIVVAGFYGPAVSFDLNIYPLTFVLFLSCC
jgi:hypothetical protein